MMMEEAGSSETLVLIHHTTRLHSGDGVSAKLNGVNPKMEATDSTGTLISIYKCTRRNIIQTFDSTTCPTNIMPTLVCFLLISSTRSLFGSEEVA
jgi:hypothetical protein